MATTNRQSSPECVVGLHDAAALGQVEAFQGTGEGAESVPVGAADEEEVVVAGSLGAAGEREVGAVGEGDSVEALKGDRGRLVGSAVDPDRALAVRRRIVDALDQVPGDRAAVGGGPDAGGPAPAGVAGLVAGRFVVDAEALDREATSRDLDRALDRHACPLAGPAPTAAAGADRFDRLGLAEAQVGVEAGCVDQEAGAVEDHLAAAGAQGGVGELAALLTVPEDPEGLAGRPDSGPRRAEHQRLAVEADVAPALAQVAVAAQG